MKISLIIIFYCVCNIRKPLIYIITTISLICIHYCNAYTYYGNNLDDDNLKKKKPNKSTNIVIVFDIQEGDINNERKKIY